VKIKFLNNDSATRIIIMKYEYGIFGLASVDVHVKWLDNDKFRVLHSDIGSVDGGGTIHSNYYISLDEDVLT